MSLHYRVDVSFSFSHGKPKLEKIEIFSTTAACTTIPISGNTGLSNYRILPDKTEVKRYIFYLYRAYPDFPRTPLVIDSGQKDLFKK